MKTLNDIAANILFSFSDESFKLAVFYDDKAWHSNIAIFDSISDDDKKWSAFKRIYGKCHVTMLSVDFREYEDGKNRIKVWLSMDDTTKTKAINEEADDETD